MVIEVRYTTAGARYTDYSKATPVEVLECTGGCSPRTGL
jgi:hypothetical protein